MNTLYWSKYLVHFIVKVIHSTWFSDSCHSTFFFWCQWLPEVLCSWSRSAWFFCPWWFLLIYLLVPSLIIFHFLYIAAAYWGLDQVPHQDIFRAQSLCSCSSHIPCLCHPAASTNHEKSSKLSAEMFLGHLTFLQIDSFKFPQLCMVCYFY